MGDGTTKCCPRCLHRITVIHFIRIVLTCTGITWIMVMHHWAGGRSLQHDKHQWRQCVPRSWRRQKNRWAKKWRLFNKKMMRDLVLYEKSVYLFQGLKILVQYYQWNGGLTYWGFLLKRCFLIDFVFFLLLVWPLWGPHCSQGQAFPDSFCDLQG